MTKKTLPIGRPSVLRHTNALSILTLLRECGSCSRADLVRASGLSAPTVTNVVNDLLSANLIEPLGEGESSGGRPPDMIRFKAERGCIAAVELSADRLSFLLTDLNGGELDTLTVDFEKRSTTPDAVCGYIAKGLQTLLKKQKKSADHLLKLVVGVPAITNVEEGSVLAISTLKDWRSVPLRTMLSKLISCPVVVENDTNLAAQGERYNGAARGEQDFVLISVGSNVGSGIVLGGKIHHGSQWSAGEIAYLRLPSVMRRRPTILEFGELETVLTSSGILGSWNEGKKSEDAKVTSGLDVLNLASSGDARAEKIVQQRAEIVADIVVNLSLILNPGLILLNGEVGGHPALIAAVQKQLEGSEFAVTKVLAGALGDRATLWGGVSLALESIGSVLLPQPAI
ncbi:ROK family protein [Silvibacterium acidisoli]|uniref:ROK family protein n=1 Tax=Acidobacteriaceae bacterium ZG23-2 TaxID=2883246 RepID=UPI00406C6A9A